MKKVIAVFSLFISLHLVAQEPVPTFRVISNGTATDINKYIDAVKLADMEAYRYHTNPDTIVFDTGVQIELFPAQQLFLAGKHILPQNYTDSKGPLYTPPLFHLTEQGTLVASYPTAPTKSYDPNTTK